MVYFYDFGEELFFLVFFSPPPFSKRQITNMCVCVCRASRSKLDDLRATSLLYDGRFMDFASEIVSAQLMRLAWYRQMNITSHVASDVHDGSTFLVWGVFWITGIYLAIICSAVKDHFDIWKLRPSPREWCLILHLCRHQNHLRWTFPSSGGNPPPRSPEGA